jgi:hypothetical protein
MKYFVFSLLFSMIFCVSCGSSDKIELTVDVVFPDGVNCRTYLADKFEIVLFDSSQRKTETRTFKCDADISSFSLFVAKEKYYVVVALKDSNGNKKSYGTGYVDASVSDADISITMAEYQGGVTFKWGTSFCNSYNIGVIRFSLAVDGDTVSTIVWGKETEIDEYEMNCSSGYFEIVNIPTGVLYKSEILAYRDQSSPRNRIEFDIPEFKLVTGQDTPVNIDEYKKIVVSDVLIKWDFDSKSIENCSDAGIGKVSVEVFSTYFNESLEMSCADNSFPEFRFFDLPKGSYELTVLGLDSNGSVKFKGTKDIDVEAGKIGKDALAYEILIFEQ